MCVCVCVCARTGCMHTYVCIHVYACFFKSYAMKFILKCQEYVLLQIECIIVYLKGKILFLTIKMYV